MDADLDVRDRLPDWAERGLDVVGEAVGVVLSIVLFFICSAVPYGYATGQLSLSVAMMLLTVFFGAMALFYGTGWVRGDDEQKVAALVTAGEFVVYGVFGVGIALLPSPASQLVSWVGIVFAGLSYVRYDWLTTRLGFEEVGEEVAV